MQTISSKKRISLKEGLCLFKEAPLEFLQKEAHSIRTKEHPGKKVSFIVDANPNYTNICNMFCSFCAFYRKENHPESYLKTYKELRILLTKLSSMNITSILLQGGVHPNVKIDYLVNIIKIITNEFPNIHPHCFSAIEISHAAKISNISIEKALEMLWEAGQRTIPGGGAEILSNPIQKKISPKKLKEIHWINFHKTAHKIGFLSTATMMFGHIETPEDILTHLDIIRNCQDETHGFLNFIPWSYKPGKNLLNKIIKQKANPELYYRILSIARIYLDNFPNIGASWFGEGKEEGKKALFFGANDFGGTIFEENVHRCAEWKITSTKQEIIDIISSAGFIPCERNSFYQDLNKKSLEISSATSSKLRP